MGALVSSNTTFSQTVVLLNLDAVDLVYLCVFILKSGDLLLVNYSRHSVLMSF